LLEPITGEDRVLDSTKLKVDSDRALKIAMAEPLLNNLTVKASQLWAATRRLGPGMEGQTVAANLKPPTKTRILGSW